MWKYFVFIVKFLTYRVTVFLSQIKFAFVFILVIKASSWVLWFLKQMQFLKSRDAKKRWKYIYNAWNVKTIYPSVHMYH